MKYTEKLGLRKPDPTDFYNLEDFNYNADKIDEELGNLDPVKLLDQIKTVDGEESGLDADMLDGKHSTAFATADHKHEMSDINNLNLTAENTTVKDTDNNFVSGTVEGALKELATKDKALDTRIGNNKTEVDEKLKEIKQSGSDFKDSVASAITAKGVSTSGTDDKQTFVNNIDSIVTKPPIKPGYVGYAYDKDNDYNVSDIFVEERYPEPTKPITFNWQRYQEWTTSMVMDSNKNIYAFYGSGNSDRKILKFSSSNELIWEKHTYQSTYKAKINKEDEIYFLSGAGSTSSVSKMDTEGNIVWKKQMLTPSSGTPSQLAIDENGNLYFNSFDSNKSNTSVLYKTDDELNIIWEKTMPYTRVDEFFCHKDKFYYQRYSMTGLERTNWLVEVDAEGDTTWEKNNPEMQMTTVPWAMNNKEELYYLSLTSNNNKKDIIILNPDKTEKSKIESEYLNLMVFDQNNYLYARRSVNENSYTYVKFAPDNSIVWSQGLSKIESPTQILLSDNKFYISNQPTASYGGIYSYTDNYINQKIALLEDK